MAKPEQNQKPETKTVRVRVKPGGQIKVGGSDGRDKLAFGGEWIEADPHDLKINSFRSCVETEEDIEKAKAAGPKGVAPVSTGEAMFDSMREASRVQNEAVRHAREESERQTAQELLAAHDPPKQAAAR